MAAPPARNPWLSRRVLAYAHQGGAREGPSSTLHAMRRSLAAGADALELDVHCTRDRQLVVCHDPTVDRTTPASGRIADMTLDEVQSLDNAHWFVPGSVVDHDAPPEAYVHRGRAPAERDFAVPTLREVLVTFPGVPLNLDIKQTAPHVEPYEELLAAELDGAGRVDDVIVASFHDAALDAFAATGSPVGTSCGPRAVAALAVALDEGEPVPGIVRRHVAVQVPPRFGGRDVVTAESVAAVHAAGLAVHVWTIDDEAEMERLLDLDVDGIMTDLPSLLVSVLRRRGVAASPAP